MSDTTDINPTTDSDTSYAMYLEAYVSALSGNLPKNLEGYSLRERAATTLGALDGTVRRQPLPLVDVIGSVGIMLATPEDNAAERSRMEAAISRAKAKMFDEVWREVGRTLGPGAPLDAVHEALRNVASREDIDLG